MLTLKSACHAINCLILASMVCSGLSLLSIRAMHPSKAAVAIVTDLVQRSPRSGLPYSSTSRCCSRAIAKHHMTMIAHVGSSTPIPNATLSVSSEADDRALQNVFVPTSIPTLDEVKKLVEFVQTRSNLIAITGAGISTSSGIPDYRGPNGSYRRGHKPMLHSEFMTSERNRKRYWARSMVGFVDFNSAKPNDAHVSLAQLESSSILKHIITQNVDRLHSKAGSQSVTDIHGRIDRVRCQTPSCQSVMSRRILQQALIGLNPAFTATYFKDRVATVRSLSLFQFMLE